MLLIATMIVTMCMQTSVAFASQGETEEPFNSTITAISSDKDSFIIETGAGCLNGNVRGGSSISTANMNVNGSVTENANIKTPILFDAIDEKYFSDFESISSVEELEKIGNNVNGAVKISNKLELNRGLNLNGALQTEGDLIIGGPAFNANNAIIVSETGNVTLKSDNISFSGLIYLPYGTLTIEGDNVNLNNVCIIADKINIKAKYNLNINSNRELIKFVDKNAVYEDNKLYIYHEAKDLVTDSNNDGICDYYTEEIKEGRLVLSNGSLELKGFDLNLNADGEPSDDWDGDGLKNGEELTIVTKFGKTYIEMKSNPFMQYTDFDEVNDYDEVKHGSDPMNYSLEKAPADSLMNSSAYAYESYANDMRYGTFNSYMIGYSSVISGVWNKQELYRNLIVDYYSNYMTTNVVNSDKKLEWKKTIYDAFKQLLPNIGTNYALANDMNIMASYINGCNSIDKINNYFESKVASFLKELNKLSEDATQLRFEVNKNGKYVAKYITEEQAVQLARKIGKLSDAMVFATSAVDLCDNINGLIEIKANEEYFAGNMDLLIKLENSNVHDLSNAAFETKGILAGKYIESVESIVDDFLMESIEFIDNVIWNFAAFKIPYVNLIAAVRNVSLAVTGVKEDVKQMYRMFCYSEMSLAYIDLFCSKISDSNNRYYNMSEMTENYLTNIAQLRILGEEEQYDFYKNDGIFSGLVNIFNNSEEVRENTNASIKYIRKHVNTLHLTLSNNMKYEV